MPINYTVKQGDSIASIAYKHGFFPDTLWNHPNNRELKANREHPNVLKPGDIVFIPDLRLKEVAKSTEQKHQFVLKGVPTKLKLRFLDRGKPKRDQPYVLKVGRKKENGYTDENGFVEFSVSPNASGGKIEVGEGKDKKVYTLNIGHLEPIESITGIAERLRNLGYVVEKGTIELTPELKFAIRTFQSRNDLEVSGEITSETKEALIEAHGS